METPDDVDSLVTCEMPCPVRNPVLHALVKNTMIHVCNGRCLVNGVCQKGFPHSFREETVMSDGRGWIALRRPSGGPTATKGGVTYDCRHVVAYNPYLLLKYQCHLNILPFRNLRQARYLFKYICKGVDKACVEKVFELYQHVIRVI
jgi:hypothetical protein